MTRAKYEGHCNTCDGLFVPGDIIHLHGERWICDACQKVRAE